jgi:hypothetical protein
VKEKNETLRTLAAEKKQDFCPICFMGLEDELVLLESCGHVMHQPCLYMYLESKV